MKTKSAGSTGLDNRYPVLQKQNKKDQANMPYWSKQCHAFAISVMILTGLTGGLYILSWVGQKNMEEAGITGPAILFLIIALGVCSGVLFRALRRMAQEIKGQTENIPDKGNSQRTVVPEQPDLIQKLQLDLEQTRQQLSESIVHADEMAEKALEADTLKSQFLSNISHEIRTPMNGVIGMTTLLLDTALTEEQRNYADMVRISADGLMDIINDILDFSRIEAHRLELERIDFNLQIMMDDTIDMLTRKAREKGLKLVYAIDPNVPALVRGDPGRLRQVLINLGKNAVKFTHQGEISLTVTRETETDSQLVLKFAMTDTGIGIPRDKQQILFQPFTQVDGSTTRKYGGTGLGLSIARQLVQLMGGNIGLESDEGNGATFWFTAALEKQQTECGRSPLADIQGVRILVVDDHETNRIPIIQYLQSWGCRFAEAENGSMALDMMTWSAGHDGGFDIALVDMHMPDMDGIELGRRIKADKRIESTRLVMITSLGLRGDAAQLEQIGFSGYMVKPLYASQLRDCLSLIMSQIADGKKGHVGLVTRYSMSDQGSRFMPDAS